MISREDENVVEFRVTLHFLIYTVFLISRLSSKDVYTFYDQRRRATNAIEIFLASEKPWAESPVSSRWDDTCGFSKV